MKKIIAHISNHFFTYTIIVAVFVVSIISYNRFMVKYDYLIEYEGECDPATQECFIGCEDDACSEEYYYVKVQKYAADLYAECGKDITDCESANTCLADDRECSIIYCDAETDGGGCETLMEKDSLGNEKNISEEELPID